VTKRPTPDKKGWLPDLSPADKYGAKEFVFEGADRVFALPAPSLHKARRKIGARFDYRSDYLLHPNTMDQMALVNCLIAILEQNPPHINMLYYDRIQQPDGSRNPRIGTYYPIRIDLRRPTQKVTEHE